LKLVRIDIDNWGSAVAKQYGIRGLPHLLLYEDGSLVTEGARQVMSKLR